MTVQLVAPGSVRVLVGSAADWSEPVSLAGANAVTLDLVVVETNASLLALVQVSVDGDNWTNVGTGLTAPGAGRYTETVAGLSAALARVEYMMLPEPPPPGEPFAVFSELLGTARL